MKKLLILLLLFHLIANLVWLFLDKSPLAWDQAGHTLISFHFLDFFKGQSQLNFLQISDFYPPLTYLIVAIGMLIFGPSQVLGSFVITIFFLTAIIFLYLYTEEVFNDEGIALFAAVFFSFLPDVYGYSRTFLLEIPATAMILGSLYFLQRSENFTLLKYSLLAALFLGGALLTKWNTVVYLAVPVFYYFTKSLQLKNLLIVLAIVLMLSLPWYLVNLASIISNARVFLTAEAVDPQILFSLQNFSYYPSILANFYLTWLGTILFLTAIPILIYFHKRIGILITSIIILSYLISSFVSNKDPRFIFLILPFASMAVAFLLVKTIRINKLWGICLSVITGSYFLFYFFTLSFGFPLDAQKVDYQRAIKLPIIGWVDYINLGKNTSKYLAPKFEAISWPQKQIITDLGSKNPDTATKVLVLVDKSELNAINLELYQKEQRNAFIEFKAPYDYLIPFSEVSKMEIYLDYFDYVLIPDKSFGLEGTLRHLTVLKQLKEYLIYYGSDKVELIKQYNLPDGDSLFIYEIK